MPTHIYDGGPNSLWIFLFATVVLGGAAAWVSGSAIAQTWRPLWQLPAYMLLLAAAVRFCHYALFAEKLLSFKSYLVDLVVLLLLAFASYHVTRSGQLARQYGWPRDDRPPAA